MEEEGKKKGEKIREKYNPLPLLLINETRTFVTLTHGVTFRLLRYLIDYIRAATLRVVTS